MRVLYLYDNYPSYRKDFFYLLSKKLKDIGHQFSFYYGREKNNASRQETESEFSIRSFQIIGKQIGGITFKYYKGFKKAFKEAKPDIVVLQFHVVVLTYWWAFFYLKRHHIPYVIWDCNYTRDTLGGRTVKLRKVLVEYTYKNAAACITYGSVFKDYLLRLGRKSEEVFVAQNTINIESIISKRSAVCSNRLFDHPIRFLYVGALLDRKYVESAVYAISNLIKQGYDVYFDIVGDGPEKDKISNAIQTSNTVDRIIMHGAKHGQDVKAFFEKDDVFLLPGTGGLAINEAMAYSMPIISTVGDDTVVDLIEGNGYLLKNFGDVNEIGKALKFFLDSPESSKIEMANKSYRIIKEKASLDNMVNQHLNAILYVNSLCKKL